MHACLIMVRRELGAYFISWIGYVVIAATILLMGITFADMIQALNSEATSLPLTEIFFQSYTFWFLIVAATPVLTMRLFAQEKQTGTFETLMTAPISDQQVVLAKFTGALVFHCLMWLPLLGFVFTLRHFTQETSALDLGALATTSLGVVLMGMLYVSIGCLASALTSSQVIAFMVSFALGGTFFLISYAAPSVPPQMGWPSAALAQMNLILHMKDFARGVMDTRALTFFLTVTFLFLFLTMQAVESRRWK
jgi:ABC-2 type transport system permease protein